MVDGEAHVPVNFVMCCSGFPTEVSQQRIADIYETMWGRVPSM